MRSTSPAADVAPRGSRVPAVIRGMLAAAGLVLVAVFVAASGTGVSWAFWNGAAPTGGATITAGTSGLLIEGQESYQVAGLATSALLPGRTVVRTQPLTLSNSGDVRLSVAWTGTTITSANGALQSSLVGSLRSAPASGSCTASADTASLPMTMAAITLAPGATATVCLEVGMTTSAPASVQGATAAVAFALTGTQVRP